MATNRRSGYYNPFVTTGGSYENPRLGIADYGAMNKTLLPITEDIEKDIKAKKEKEKKDKIALKGIDTARGSIGEDVLNPNDALIMQINEVVKNQQAIINSNASDEDKTYAKNSYLNIANANTNVQELINIDDNKEIYDLSASDLNDLFLKNTDGKYSYDDFKKKWNEGGLKIGVKKLESGMQVGGFYTGDGDFINFETGINKDTIMGNMSLQHKSRTQELIKAYNEKNHGHGKNNEAPWVNWTTKLDLNTREGINQQTKRKGILDTYDQTIKTAIGKEVLSYMNTEPDMMNSVFKSLDRDGRWINGNNATDAQWLGMYNMPEKGSIGTWNDDKVNDAITGLNLVRTNNGQKPLSNEEAEEQIKEDFDTWKKSKIKGYLENEFLLQTGGYEADGNGRARLQSERILKVETKGTPKTEIEVAASGFGNRLFSHFGSIAGIQTGIAGGGQIMQKQTITPDQFVEYMGVNSAKNRRYFNMDALGINKDGSWSFKAGEKEKLVSLGISDLKEQASENDWNDEKLKDEIAKYRRNFDLKLQAKGGNAKVWYVTNKGKLEPVNNFNGTLAGTINAAIEDSNLTGKEKSIASNYAANVFMSGNDLSSIDDPWTQIGQFPGYEPGSPIIPEQTSGTPAITTSLIYSTPKPKTN
tara:strand:+ start:8103 stop:10037 length:1935 start_codon:yes stop_codon:yes gene_type:complete